MTENKTDREILKEIFLNHVWGNKTIRAIIIPSIIMTIISKYLEVSISEFAKSIADNISKKITISGAVIHYAGLLIFSNVFSESQMFFACRAGQIALRIGNQKTYKYFLELDPENFHKLGKGEIQNLIMRKSEAIRDLIDIFTLNIFPSVFTLLFINVDIVRNFGLMSAILTNIFVFIYGFATIKITEFRNTFRKYLNNSTNYSNNRLLDGLMNFDIIYTTNTKESEVQRYGNTLYKIENDGVTLARSMYFLNMVQKLILSALSISIIILVSSGLIHKSLSAKDYVFVLSISGLIANSLFNFGFMYGKYKQAMLNIRISLPTGKKNHAKGTFSHFCFTKEISISNLTLRHDEDRILLNKTSLYIKKGEKIAVIGHNGCGKSTLLKYMAGLKDAENGSFFIDGYDISEISDYSYRNLIGYVPQNPNLFNDTVLYNIKYGSNCISDEEVYFLSKKLGIHDSILRLPKKYNTVVGELGGNLSGGERQKILILRSLLNGTPILLFDESTSNLDRSSELSILEYITSEPDLTVIFIIHNMSILHLFDKKAIIKEQKIHIMDNILESDLN